MSRAAILLFVKNPEPGKVKTRLAAGIGEAAALAAYKALVAHVCSLLPERSADVLVHYAPRDAGQQIGEWMSCLLPNHAFQCVPQAEGDLGDRLESAFRQAFDLGYGTAIAIGSDCVEITPETFAEAGVALETHDVVLGPSFDGGYYLIGLKRPEPELFRGIAWSTCEVFRETMERAATANLSVYPLPVLHDVDTEDDWRRAQARMKP